ncbi:hypothetical protein BVE84_10095 [Streptococcus azizii]|uniref:Uncharacterized protein n=1 Tax=Streptococcus azizii TaxID=1579424 RepID=A0AB36JMF6_9STRE|nr:hypothetical protein BVE85_10085 [Streptococcus azizii]ONK25585.1 hypothetical protein BVE84_10095 [Streptococcus azizii]ONK26003.1 hypothetical protein BVE86_08680 [Streptococcus azizii]
MKSSSGGFQPVPLKQDGTIEKSRDFSYFNYLRLRYKEISDANLISNLSQFLIVKASLLLIFIEYYVLKNDDRLKESLN